MADHAIGRPASGGKFLNIKLGPAKAGQLFHVATVRHCRMAAKGIHAPTGAATKIKIAIH